MSGASNTGSRAAQPGHAARAYGTSTLYTAQRLPRLGDAVLSVTRTLGSGERSMEAIELRVFLAASPDRTVLPRLPGAALIRHDAGLGWARARLTGAHAAVVDGLELAGATASLRQTIADGGVFEWMLRQLEVELACCNVIHVELQPADDPGDIDPWLESALVQRGYSRGSEAGAWLAVMLDRHLVDPSAADPRWS